jgi:hypothetical protein
LNLVAVYVEQAEEPTEEIADGLSLVGRGFLFLER